MTQATANTITTVALAAALAAALVYWAAFAARPQPGPIGTSLKTASTGLMAMVLCALSPATPWFWLVPLGLALGAVGDFFLALKGERSFLAGMAAFGLGHLAYAAALLLRSRDLGFDGFEALEMAALLGLLALVASTHVWLAPRTGKLTWPVRGYIVLIALMGAAAIALPRGAGRDELRAGAALFIASDLMLAIRMFVTSDAARQRRLSLALWPAYWLGQALIAAGALLFWTTSKG